MLADLARRDGRPVLAFDLFGDLDLRRRADRVVTAGRLTALVDAALAEPPGSVVYGASFENHPALVARLAERHALLGNPPGTLRAVRDPVRLGAALRDAGSRSRGPPSRPASAAGAAQAAARRRGTRVRGWRGGALPAGTFVQERIDGLACSAAAVGDGVDAVVLGLTEQLVGERAFGVRGYRWCGNLTPPRLPAGEREALLRQARAICSHLAAAFALRGLFGVDFIWDGERAWTHEVNPRPTASLEAIESAYGVGVFDAHLRGCAGELPRVAAAALERRRQGRPVRHRGRDVGDSELWLGAECAMSRTPASGSPRAIRSAPSSRPRRRRAGAGRARGVGRVGACGAARGGARGWLTRLRGLWLRLRRLCSSAGPLRTCALGDAWFALGDRPPVAASRAAR